MKIMNYRNEEMELEKGDWIILGYNGYKGVPKYLHGTYAIVLGFTKMKIKIEALDRTENKVINIRHDQVMSLK